MTKKLNILIIADPYIPVPPKGYGGIERIIAMIIESYQVKGHQVTLLCHPDSKVPCKKIFYGSPPHFGIIPRFKEVFQVWKYLFFNRNFDVIHSFGRLIGLMPFVFSKKRLLQSYQRKISKRNSLFGNFLFRNLSFTSCSSYMHEGLVGDWYTVYNGVDTEIFEFSDVVREDAPLVFLGRIEKIKGCHNAIAVSKLSGRKLIIAGNISDKDYFDNMIKPYIDNKKISYVGEVGDEQKNKLLGTAYAFLMPIEWEEPFGIVMAEALACGTPILGFNRGSVPEIIQHGKNGFISETVEEMVSQVEQISFISRKECRKICEEKFSKESIAKQYLELYNDV